MDVINTFFIAPLADIASGPLFFLEVVIGGLLAGVMYSLVALGFVLIYKASGVFNYAQGAMVLFAALTLVGLMEHSVPLILAVIVTMGVMVGVAFLTERYMLRPLVNQAQIILFMATIGLNFVFEGTGQIAWGSNVKKLDIGIPDESFMAGGILFNTFDLTAAGVAAVLVIVLAVFFQKTAVGRALRAVADDHQAALSVGIPLKTIWVIVWSVSGFVALVAGIMWGGKAGVQFSL
ncbi:MAG: branched-chain amino acid ABC transporter permease, partial [Rhodospirillaceae bacterium]